MSWWDTTQLASFATQALKTAQKRIDKVLDIKDEEEATTESEYSVSSLVPSSPPPSNEWSNVSSDVVPLQKDEFFEAWLGDDRSGGWAKTNTSSEFAKETSPEISNSVDMRRKSKLIGGSGRRRSPSEFKSRTAALSMEADGQEVASEPDRPAVKTETGLKLDFFTSAKSAFDQVPPQQKAAVEKNLENTGLKAASSYVELQKRKSAEYKYLRMAAELTENERTDEQKRGNTAFDVSVTSEGTIDVPNPKKSDEALKSKKGIESIKAAVDEDGVRDCMSVTMTEMPTSELLLSDIDSNSFAIKNSLTDNTGWTDMSLSVSERLIDEVIPGDDYLLSLIKKDKSKIDEDVNEATTDDNFNASTLLLTISSASDSQTDLPPAQDLKRTTSDSKVTFKADDISLPGVKDKVVADDDGGTDVLRSRSCGSLISASSEADITLKEVVSLEGSLAASDELSESNKTLTADDLDIAKDDTDIDESKPDELHHDNPETTNKNDVVDEDDGIYQMISSDAMTRHFAELSVANDDPGTEKSEMKDADSPRSTQSSSSSSYVKNLLEEAMAESIRDGSHGLDVVRVESEQTSGHTSADEIDTTTSSDIEIISHISTPNNNFRPLVVDTKAYDMSPTKTHSWSRSVASVSPHGHRRSNSGSSAQSLQSRNGEDVLSPESGHHRSADLDERNWRHHLQGRKSHGLDQCKRQSIETASDSDAASNPYDTEKLLKKLAEMAHVLDAREKKQLEMSQENIDLMETNNVLRNQLKQMEEAREAEIEDVKEVTDEFTRRLSDAEKKLQSALREKEIIKKVSLDLETGKRSENVMTEKLLKEKEQVISELLEEGEKLSKQQLQSNNIIKKLRKKEIENEENVKSFKQQVDEQKEEIVRLEAILESKVDTEKKHVDTINQLNLALKSQEDEINRLKSELEDAVEKARSMKAALDNSYKEISELHKARVSDVSEAHKIAFNAEMQAKEKLKLRLEELQMETKQQNSALINQIEDLQMSLCRMEKEHSRKEDILRQETSDLQQRLQEAEERNQELMQSVSAATRPLLRQIENLQMTYSVQSTSYERVEKNLTERLSEAQNQLAAAVEKERMSSDRLMEATARTTSFESQVTTLRQERAQLQSQFDMEHAKVELMQETKNNKSIQRDTTIHKLQLEINDLKKDKVLIENQLEMEKLRVEAEKKKVALVHEQIKEKEMMIMQMSSQVVTSKHDSMMDSFSSSSSTLCSTSNLQDDMMERSSLMSTPNNRISIYDSLRLSSTSTILESLQSQLKQRDGEIVQLQSDISELERTRESMARQMVTLTLTNEDLEKKLNELEMIHKKFMDLDGRYNALLQMYGEKVEEGDELRMDLQDIKEMYKTQIDELLKNNVLPPNWNF